MDEELGREAERLGPSQVVGENDGVVQRRRHPVDRARQCGGPRRQDERGAGVEHRIPPGVGTQVEREVEVPEGQSVDSWDGGDVLCPDHPES